MNKFLIKYTSGLQEEIKCGLESVELFCNQHFGSTWGEAYENGATVDMVALDVEHVADVVAEIAPLVAPEVAAVATVVAEVAASIVADETPAA